MPLDQFGPVKFSIEGTFTEKPRLLMNGEEVSYDRLYISHSPEYKYLDFDGKEVVEPPSTFLDFSVSAQVGQLEANVTYRVKANDDKGLVLAKKMDKDEKKDGKKPPFKKNDKKGGDDKSKDGKPDFKKLKKSESYIGFKPDARSPLGQQIWRLDLAENIAETQDD